MNEYIISSRNTPNHQLDSILEIYVKFMSVILHMRKLRHRPTYLFEDICLTRQNYISPKPPGPVSGIQTSHDFRNKILLHIISSGLHALHLKMTFFEVISHMVTQLFLVIILWTQRKCIQLLKRKLMNVILRLSFSLFSVQINISFQATFVYLLVSFFRTPSIPASPFRLCSRWVTLQSFIILIYPGFSIFNISFLQSLYFVIIKQFNST